MNFLSLLKRKIIYNLKKKTSIDHEDFSKKTLEELFHHYGSDKANIFNGRTKRLNPGDTVIVPVEPNPSDFDITTFIADLSTTLANIAAILLIVDNQTD